MRVFLCMFSMCMVHTVSLSLSVRVIVSFDVNALLHSLLYVRLRERLQRIFFRSGFMHTPNETDQLTGALIEVASARWWRLCGAVLVDCRIINTNGEGMFLCVC